MASDDQDFNLHEMMEKLRKGVTVKTRRYHLQKFEKCFVGKEAIDFLVKSGLVNDRTVGVQVAQILEQAKLIKHVTGDREFSDGPYFYRFASDEADHGRNADEVDWADFADATGEGGRKFSTVLPESVIGVDGEIMEDEMEDPVAPLDEHNVKLLNNVKPAKWVNPKAQKKYNMVVIGAGAGGLVTAAACAGLGAKVAIIEKHMLGGDCLNVGCVPSKALIRCARAARELKGGAEFGLDIAPEHVKVDFGKVMERMRKLRADIAPVDSADRFSRELGVDVFQGHGQFVSRNKVKVGGQILTFSKACIATGGKAAVPPVPGLTDVDYLTNATLFNLTELPKRFGVLGAGPIGMEMAQAFSAFGAEVNVYERQGKILPREDPDAAAIVQKYIVEDGVKLHLQSSIISIAQKMDEATGKKVIQVHYTDVDNVEHVDELDELLVSTGRSPNVKGLGLENAKVKYNNRGVEIDDYLRTTNKNIFAVGDVCSKYQFTHVADFMARKVVRNALFRGSDKNSKMQIPWCTYTSPEVAHVGATTTDLKSDNVEYDVYVKELKDVDRAILEGEREKSGFVKVFTKKGKDTILGATIVAADAGDLISEISVAMQHGVGLGGLADVIHPYPTTADAIRACGALYKKTLLTPGVKALFRFLMDKQR